MKKLNENLSEIFDVEPINLEEKETTTTEVVVSGTNSVVELDTDFARINIKSLIKKGNVAIDDLLQVAKHSEHPRAYEVAATLIKNLSDLNKDLLEIQKRKQDLQGIKPSNDNKDVNIDKAVFVGSTNELMKLLKNKE
jgi:hypothetical protein